MRILQREAFRRMACHGAGGAVRQARRPCGVRQRPRVQARGVGHCRLADTPNRITSSDGRQTTSVESVGVRHRVDNGDLLVSWSASLDAFLWESGPAVLNQHIFKVQEHDHLVDRRFLYYALRAAMRTIRGQIHGATMQHITKPKFLSTLVSLPEDLDEQRQIAGALDERFADIAKMRAEARNQRMAAFDCTGAVLQRALQRVHGSEVTTVKLGSVLDSCQYGSSAKADAGTDATPMLRMGNIDNGRIDFRNLAFIRLADRELASYRLRPGDVLINRTNSAELVGKSALFDAEGEYVFASYLIRLATKRQRLVPGYLQAVLSSSLGRAYIDRVKHQSVGQSNINGTEIKAMPIPLPSTDEQELVLAELNSAQPVIDRMVGAAEELNRGA